MESILGVRRFQNLCLQIVLLKVALMISWRFVFHKSLNGRHLTTSFCHRGEVRKRRHLEGGEARVGTETSIIVYGIPLSPVTSFKYLERVLSESYDNWSVVVHNLKGAQDKGERLSRVLISQDTDARTSGRIYVLVVQAVVMYGP